MWEGERVGRMKSMKGKGESEDWEERGRGWKDMVGRRGCGNERVKRRGWGGEGVGRIEGEQEREKVERREGGKQESGNF